MLLETNCLESVVKAKVSRGGGFRGIAEYALGDAKGAEFVASNVTGRNPRALAAEFAISRHLRPDINRPVWHTSLALPAGERLDDDRWQAVVHDYMDGMGFDRDKHQFVAVRHQDTKHDHVHVIASRIGLDGSVWHGQWEARKAIELTQVLEERHGLTRTPGYRQKDEKSLTKGEVELAVRTEQAPPKKVLQALINEAAQGSPTVVQFAEKLVMSGVEVRANLASTGTLSGFSFGLGGYAFKGSQLGKKFSWKALKAQGVIYEQNRDREQLERFSGATAGQPEDSDDIRIAVDAGHDQRPTGTVSEHDRSAVEGFLIPADRSDSEPAKPAPGDDRKAVNGNPGSSGDRHSESSFSGDGTIERTNGESSGGDTESGVASLRSNDAGASWSDEPGPEGHDNHNRPDEPRAAPSHIGYEGGAGRNGRGARNEQTKTQGGGKIGSPSHKDGPVSRNKSSQHWEADDRGYVFGGLSGLASDLWNLADRHVIASEQARKAIDDQLAKCPANARPSGRRVSTSRLSRWFSATKATLSKFIDKAMSYFNDAAVRSADKAGWALDEIRSAGLTGDLLNRAEALQAAEAARESERAQLLEQAEQVNKIDEDRQKSSGKPQEPDIQFFDDGDDDEPQGPGLV